MELRESTVRKWHLALTQALASTLPKLVASPLYRELILQTQAQSRAGISLFELLGPVGEYVYSRSFDNRLCLGSNPAADISYVDVNVLSTGTTKWV